MVNATTDDLPIGPKDITVDIPAGADITSVIAVAKISI
ncbi:unnamed protein product, partial [marine sediment metagenome]